MNILGFDPYLDPIPEHLAAAEMLPLPLLLEKADIVSVQVPLNETTYNLIGAEQLSLMKPGAILINAARFEVVDGEAMLFALSEKRLKGAAVDSLKELSGRDTIVKKLLEDGSLILTPHIGAYTREAQIGIGLTVCQDILRVLDGSPPHNPV